MGGAPGGRSQFGNLGQGANPQISDPMQNLNNQGLPRGRKIMGGAAGGQMGQMGGAAAGPTGGPKPPQLGGIASGAAGPTGGAPPQARPLPSMGGAAGPIGGGSVTPNFSGMMQMLQQPQKQPAGGLSGMYAGLAQPKPGAMPPGGAALPQMGAMPKPQGAPPAAGGGGK